LKIGVLGGTFDPPHLGHLALAKAAMESLSLDEVLWVPANRNPLKSGRRQASARDRLEMVRLMIADEPAMAVSDLEIGRGGPSYAVETLDELHFVKPADYWFILGSDAVRDIGTWKNPEKLLRLCRLGVAYRAPESWDDVLSRIRPEFRERLDPVTMPPMDVSSTEVRLRLARKQPVGALMHPAVLKYVREHKLYEN
jgi:nicotinate-nucleotide adenylyltransferase